ncbi:hypothetical protein AGROH133_06390 [Agrobacterium tumefaciens]|nr:hypothetical protein AGROH133_06390 [Agrobacterium tumefaciens]
MPSCFPLRKYKAASQIANSSRLIDAPEPIPGRYVRVVSPPMEGEPDESPAGKSTGLPFPFQPNHTVGYFWRAADAS